MNPAAAVFLTVATAAACSSSSVLIRPDDSTFTRQQRHLARTAEAIDKDSPAPTAADRALFLQGEGFYRYRFEPPPKRLSTYLAQAAAVAADLPMFQSVAGALDLMDLRLKSYDGAVHIWESLLVRSPGTPLRPLTLYRLGWAYRNSAASGFPRQSGAEAFDELLREHASSPLAALAREANGVPWKSRDTVNGLSIVPGLGQMYVGEYGNGTARLAAALGCVALVAAPAYLAYNRRDDLTWGRDWPLLATSLAGLILLSIDYTLAYQDAQRGTVQWNERAEAAFEDRHPEAP